MRSVGASTSNSNVVMTDGKGEGGAIVKLLYSGHGVQTVHPERNCWDAKNGHLAPNEAQSA